MSVPQGSERREVTVEILYPQILAGLNVFNPQGQIKCESKNKVQVVKNGEHWFVFFSSRYRENRTCGLLTHFQLW